MYLGICADPATVAELPVPLSFDFIEGNVQQFLRPEASDAEFSFQSAALRNCPRMMPAANCLFPADLKVVGPSVDYERIERYGRAAFRRAQAVGMHVIVFGSAGARQCPEGFSRAQAFEQYIDVLRQLAPIAADHEVTLVVEPLNRGECNIVNSLEEGAEAARRANHPRVKLLVDIFHMLRDDEPASAILNVGPLVHHAHVAENKNRAAPGVNGDDFRPYFRALHQIGYRGALTLECVWDNIATQVAPALAILRGQLADAGY